MRAPGSLWRHRDFLLLWGGQSVSEVGSQVTLLALPLLAVTTLHATTLQVAALSAAGSAAFLVVALQAGALVDRWRTRRVMVWADLLRAVVLATVPLAHVLGVLTLAQLYAVALATSVLTVFFDVAHQSFLPVLVTGEQLVDGNARLAGSSAFAGVAGPGVGGALVGVVGAAWAVAVDVGSFVVSTVLTARIRDPQPPPAPRAAGRAARRAARRARPRLRTEVREGLVFVLTHPVLRKVVACTATSNSSSSSAGAALEVVFLVRVLGASPRVIGGVLALGALGGLAGAALSARLARRVGSARTIWVSILAEVPFAFATRRSPRPRC